MHRNTRIASGDYRHLRLTDVEGIEIDDSGAFTRLKVADTVENDCINGMFDLWQRGTSFSATGYGPDRWRLGVSGVTTLLSQSVVAASENTGYQYQARLTQTASSLTSDYLLLRYRLINIRKYAGKRVQFSFRIYQTADSEIAVACAMVFGSGGSSQVQLQGLKYSIEAVKWLTISGYFDVPSLDSSSNPVDGNCLQIRVFTTGGSDYDEFTDSLGHQPANTTYLRDFKMYVSDVAMPVRRRSLAETLHECEFYYQKTYEQEVYPGAITANGSIGFQVSSSSGSAYFPIRAKRTMRGTPTLTFYSPNSGAAGNIYYANATIDLAVTGASGTSDSTYFYSLLSAGFVDAAKYRFHVTAEAEL